MAWDPSKAGPWMEAALWLLLAAILFSALMWFIRRILAAIDGRDDDND